MSCFVYGAKPYLFFGCHRKSRVKPHGGGVACTPQSVAMKNTKSALFFSRIRKSTALAAVCLLGLPLMAQARDNNNGQNLSWQSVSGFLTGLGNNLVGRGQRAVDQNQYRQSDARYYSRENSRGNYQYQEPRARYYDQQYSRSNSVEGAVQLALARNGYYNGPVDGMLGPMSRRAIANYQADRGLRVTGYPNSSLLNSLGLQ